MIVLEHDSSQHVESLQGGTFAVQRTRKSVFDSHTHSLFRFESTSLAVIDFVIFSYIYISYIYIPFVNWSIASIVIPATGCVDRATMCRYGPQFMGIWYIYIHEYIFGKWWMDHNYPLPVRCWYPMHTRNNGNAMSYVTMVLDTYWYW